MLGMNNLKSIEELKKMQEKVADKKVDLKKFNSLVAQEAGTSLNTFLNAVETGNKSLEEHAEAFDDASDPNTQIISIAEWRQLGIMPLASGKERK